MRYQFRQMLPSDIPRCISLIDDAFSNCIDLLNSSFESKEREKPPWSWYGYSNLSFHVLTVADDEVNGYIIWRNIYNTSHLHSFLVSAQHQQKGAGTKALSYYESESLKINPNTNIFTLHSYKSTVYNHIFYQRNGYEIYDDNRQKIDELNDWIENCKRHSDWPLTRNKVLLFKLRRCFP